MLERLALLARAIAELPLVLCLRDYQSQNLMLDSRGELRVIDYQDALLAPAELDLAAFLHDSYICLSAHQREELLSRYERHRGVHVDRTHFALLIVQRKCKDFGRYRFVVEHKGDERYAPYLERARSSVGEALDQLPSQLAATRESLRAALGVAT